MNSSDAPTSRYDSLETKKKLVAKLLIPIKKNGISHLRTDDIARHMDLSKATLYKYFSSKDEIIELVVELYVMYFVEMNEALEEAADSYVRGFQMAFEKMVLHANYGSEAFWTDLRELYPELMQRVHDGIAVRNRRLRAFYQRGMEAGVFVSLNPDLLILQDELLFGKLVDPQFLMARNLTFRDALFDTYEMRKRLLFPSERCGGIADDEMKEKLEYLALKIARSMM
ncbi:TetR/AcrR family transcriptional regulator [Tumebacillus sp. DT12]|uniref:TetR/AcrR family transcriptional regulator n=1 Tax=Tumebacillus lacus TaxID=2995335 RepID=A0ABT3WYX4_9BACL|nr:TetR/AcrR family transcriptional regulator [Tumebacillus lacus]MCX7569411.1 TetR/AcrR family transcriptional regulator [Tumebacillus lacus]